MNRHLPLLLAFLISALATAAPAEVLKAVIEGPIHPITDEYVERAIAAAADRNAEALLIEMRTPGGLVESTRHLVNRILTSPVPVIIYVSPSGSRAASAGFFILMSADVAAMAPGTNTGAAHPVVLFGGDQVDEVMKQKMVNDTAAFMRTIASRRGRNVELAQAAVLESTSWTEQEALENGLIDYVARNERELLGKVSEEGVRRFDGRLVRLDLKDDSIVPFEMTLRQQLLSFIMDPNVAFILFSLGVLGLWVELNHPGLIVPGVIGLIAILLAVFAFNLLPTRFAALILILAAFALFFLEAQFSTHGILGIGGVVCMAIGALLLVDAPIPEMRISLATALVVSIPFGIIAIFLMSLAIRSRKARVSTGEEGIVGEVGVTRTPLSPDGKIFVHGELWNAVSPVPVDEGRQVVVRGIRGLELQVEPVPPEGEPATESKQG